MGPPSHPCDVGTGCFAVMCRKVQFGCNTCTEYRDGTENEDMAITLGQSCPETAAAQMFLAAEIDPEQGKDDDDPGKCRQSSCKVGFLAEKLPEAKTDSKMLSPREMMVSRP